MALPNLPKLASASRAGQTNPILLPGQWNLIAMADPTRWSIGFSAGLTGGVQVSTVPDPAGFNGFNVGNQLVEFKYKDWLALVQQEWYAFDIVGRGTLDLFIACIPFPYGHGIDKET